MIELLSNFSNDAEILKEYVEYKELIFLGAIFGWLFIIKEIVFIILNFIKGIINSTKFLFKNMRADKS